MQNESQPNNTIPLDASPFRGQADGSWHFCLSHQHQLLLVVGHKLLPTTSRSQRDKQIYHLLDPSVLIKSVFKSEKLDMYLCFDGFNTEQGVKLYKWGVGTFQRPQQSFVSIRATALSMIACFLLLFLYFFLRISFLPSFRHHQLIEERHVTTLLPSLTLILILTMASRWGGRPRPELAFFKVDCT